MIKPLHTSLLVTCLWVLPALSFASGSSIKLVQNGTPHEALFAVDFEEHTGYAVGAGGAIFRSDDAGDTWSPESAPNQMSLLGVSIKDDRAIVVGQLGAIAVKNGDKEWMQVDSGTQERLFNVDMNSSGLAVAVGAFGTLLRSTDYGATWQSLKPQWEGKFEDPDMRLGPLFEPSLYGVQVNEHGRVWVCGELGLIMSSTDGGQTWRFDSTGISSVEKVSPTLSALSIRKDGVGYAVGQEGIVMQTRNFGETWRRFRPTTNANLLGVSSTPDGLVVTTGMREMQLSLNDGDKWFYVRGSDIKTGWYQGVSTFASNTEVIVVGNSARILKLTVGNKPKHEFATD